MGTIQMGIELQDNFSAPLMNIMDTVQDVTASMAGLHNAMSMNIDTSSFAAMQSEIDAALSSIDELQLSMQDTVSPNIRPQIDVPESMQVPIQPVVMEQPQIDVDNIQVPVTPVVAEQPRIDVPESIEIPVNPIIQETPQIDVPNEIDILVTPVVGDVPQIDVPESMQVPIQPVVTEQPQIDIQFHSQHIEQVQNLLQRVSSIQQDINQQSASVFILPDDIQSQIQAVNNSIEQMGHALDMIRDNPFDLPTETVQLQIISLTEHLREALQEQLQINDALSHMDIEIENPPPVTVPVSYEQPEPVSVPVHWQTDSLEVFRSTGLERFQSEIESTNTMLGNLNDMQMEIANNAGNMNILPSDAISDIQNLQSRIQELQISIEQVSLDIGSDEANAQLEHLRMQLSQVFRLQNNLNNAMQGMDIENINEAYLQLSHNISSIERNVRDNFSSPVEIPVTWRADSLEVFTATGIERFQQEVQSTNTMLEQLSSTQDAIARQAYNTNLLPPEAFQDLNRLAVRIDMVRDRIEQIENNPLNIGTDAANTELEQLRSQLNQAVEEQNELNQAMQNMDVSAANDAYLRLSQTIGNTERYIRDNTGEQSRFNREINEGTVQANGLLDAIRDVAATYLGIQAVGSVLNISDELTQTSARLNLVRDEYESLAELQDRIYDSAERCRVPYIDMASSVAKLANNTGDVFDNNQEIIAFLEAVNKQFVIGGSSAESMAGAMIQLTQGLAAGALRGDELNSVLEGAPGIARLIERSMGWAEGAIKSYAEEGLVTAEVVKNALLSSTAEINEQFESLPETWGQVLTGLQNDVLQIMEPILQDVNDIANSDGFQGIADTIMQSLSVLANSGVLQNFITEAEQTLSEIANSPHFHNFVNNLVQGVALVITIITGALDLIGMVGGFIADNWSIIEPIILGVAAAFGVYKGALVAYNAVQTISNGLAAISAAREAFKTSTTLADVAATTTATGAQVGFNAALLACPLIWTILLIIALTAVIFAVCSAIAELTGVADSGFGVIAGGINVVIQFFWNLFLTALNILAGIGSAVWALGGNIMAAFQNAITSVQSWFYDLLSTALSVVAKIAEALNQLPFVELDYSGITSAADEYAARSAEAAGNRQEYQSIGDAFNEGFSTFDTFQDGWVSDAFDAGAAWGDGISTAVDNFSFSDIFGMEDIPDEDKYYDYTQQDYTAQLAGMNNSLDSISGDTGNISDAMDIAEEDLKCLRDLAEQESVNRYTVAEVSVDMSGMQNTVNNGGDLDGFVSGLIDAVNEAVDSITEGVHV